MVRAQVIRRVRDGDLASADQAKEGRCITHCREIDGELLDGGYVKLPGCPIEHGELCPRCFERRPPPQRCGIGMGPIERPRLSLGDGPLTSCDRRRAKMLGNEDGGFVEIYHRSSILQVHLGKDQWPTDPVQKRRIESTRASERSQCLDGGGSGVSRCIENAVEIWVVMPTVVLSRTREP
jgi:hypothetical protein